MRIHQKPYIKKFDDWYFQWHVSMTKWLKWNVFFAPSMNVSLASPQAGWLSIYFFNWKIRSVAPEWRTPLRTDSGIEKRKSPAPGGIWSHDLSLMRRVLSRCATTTAGLALIVEIFTLTEDLVHFFHRAQPRFTSRLHVFLGIVCHECGESFIEPGTEKMNLK